MKEETKRKISESKKGNKNPNWKEGLPVIFNEKTEKDFAYLVGYWMGDGLKTGRGSVILSFAVRNNTEYINNLVTKASNILGTRLKYKYINDGSCGLNFYSETKNLRELIGKELEEKVFIRKHPWHFITGFLDSDGWMCQDNPAYATKKDVRGCVQIGLGNTNFNFITILSNILDEVYIPYKVSLSYKGELHKKPSWAINIKGVAGQYVFSKNIQNITIDKRKIKYCSDLIEYYEQKYLTSSLPICETFKSVQGEGKNTGRIQFFIRASTCSMKCKICDSKYSWKKMKKENWTSLQDLLVKAEQSGVKEVCLTGGEIAQFRNKMMALVAFLRVRNFYIVLQTNGLHYNPAFDLIHTVSMDMKTPSTGEKSNEGLIYKLKPKDEIKTLINNEKDYRYAMRINKKVLASGCSHVLQPLNLLKEDTFDSLIEKYKWISEAVVKDERWKNVRVVPQLHVLIWGNKRGV